MNAGDVCLIGRTPYAVASNPALPLFDGQLFTMLGGTVTFSQGNGDFLLDMLPAFLLVPRSSPASGAVTTILALLDGEMERLVLVQFLTGKGSFTRWQRL